jgi:branched-chain amino acid transport system permease protein
MLASLSVLLFNGVSYGVLLFLMACGLTVTMGLMRFANLAHAVFAMFGGYAVVTCAKYLGSSFYASLVLATLLTGIFGALLERVVFRYFYNTSELRQVLMTVSVVFMSIGAFTYFFGPSQQQVSVPPELVGMSDWGGFAVNAYRVLLLVCGALLTAALFAGLTYTRFGATLRAAVDNRRMAISCGIDVERLFFWAFSLGCALAGLGGALSVNLLSLDPMFGLRYLAYVMFIVVVGGLGSVGGSFVASLVIGIVDVASKYFWPEIGGFSVYAVAALCLIIRPHGILRSA